MTVTLYDPALVALKLVTEGVGDVEVKPLGPVQEYDADTPKGSAGLNETERFAVEPFETH